MTGDLQSVVDWSARERLPGPHFLLGHSNGGQVALRLMLRQPASIAALILSNPALRVAMPIPPAKLKIGRLLLKYAPWITLKGDLRPACSRETRLSRKNTGRTRCGMVA